MYMLMIREEKTNTLYEKRPAALIELNFPKSRVVRQIPRGSFEVGGHVLGDTG